jgi:hypothetical protein
VRSGACCVVAAQSTLLFEDNVVNSASFDIAARITLKNGWLFFLSAHCTSAINALFPDVLRMSFMRHSQSCEDSPARRMPAQCGKRMAQSE